MNKYYRNHLNLHPLHNTDKEDTAKGTTLSGRDHNPPDVIPGVGLTSQCHALSVSFTLLVMKKNNSNYIFRH